MLKFNRIPYSIGANRVGPKNSNVQYFSGTEFEKIDTLVRETIQNPMDNILDPTYPVVFALVCCNKAANRQSKVKD